MYHTNRNEKRMTMIEQKLKGLGIELPVPVAPIANYVGFVVTGNLLVISGQLPIGADGKLNPAHVGKLGGSVTPEAGVDAARICAINLLAQAKSALGNLDRIVRCVRLGGFINGAPGFTALPAAMNGASNLMVEALGDKGRHARTTIGVGELPLGAVIEVEAMFEIAP